MSSPSEKQLVSLIVHGEIPDGWETSTDRVTYQVLADIFKVMDELGQPLSVLINC